MRRKLFCALLAALLCVSMTMTALAEENSTLLRQGTSGTFDRGAGDDLTQAAGVIEKDMVNQAFTFTCLDGKTLSSTSHGKAKLLIFFAAQFSTDSNHMMEAINASSWVKDSRVEVYAIEAMGNDRETVAAYKSSHCPAEEIQVCYDESGQDYDAMFRYWGCGYMQLPVTVMIDENNRVRFLAEGYLGEDEINNRYLPQLLSDWTPTENANPIVSIQMRTRTTSIVNGIIHNYYRFVSKGETRELVIGDELYVEGNAIPQNMDLDADYRVVAEVSDESVCSYDLSDKTLKALGEGTATLTFSSVSNPEVTSYLNIVVRTERTDVTPTPSPTGTPAPTPGGGWPFQDVAVTPGGWKYDNIKYVYERGVMTGVEATEFQPDAALTRSQFASVIYRMAGKPNVTYKNIFSDVPAGKWYSDAIIWAYENNIVAGLGDGSYGIDANITREQMARMLMEFARVRGYGTGEQADLSRFADVSQVSRWATEYMRWAVGSGMISGSMKDGRYYMNPRGQATRAECATMLAQFIKKHE